MKSDSRKRVVLAVLLLVMGALWLRVWLQTPPGDALPATTTAGRSRTIEPSARNTTIGVDLAALQRERPAPAGTRRNPFQFGGIGQPEVPAVFAAAPPSVTTPSAAPAGAAQPTLNLTLIGIVQPVGDAPRVAVLSDERGVYHGTEGTIIEGRYRIVSIDAQSVELSSLDGRGLYVLRLPPS
jgi:hypothetical protein